ncbi:hypothetical protein NQ318_019007 [Aromia moschata]|uniref:Uncharacterized protein n=1 Tax=Aromia moschata TaxID=1265417 RepID=A0AAV8YGT4_9CUCU|nr:hypothetical protein NQ318_019007 [Aromia moschata]
MSAWGKNPKLNFCLSGANDRIKILRLHSGICGGASLQVLWKSVGLNDKYEMKQSQYFAEDEG